MRKHRDFDAELRTLTDKTKSLKDRKLRHLGELVTATGADALDAETLAGALLAIVEAGTLARKESWRKRGHAFFQRRPRGYERQCWRRRKRSAERRRRGIGMTLPVPAPTPAPGPWPAANAPAT